MCGMPYHIAGIMCGVGDCCAGYDVSAGSMEQLEEMGQVLCDTILDYCDPDQSKVNEALRLFPAVSQPS